MRGTTIGVTAAAALALGLGTAVPCAQAAADTHRPAGQAAASPQPGFTTVRGTAGEGLDMVSPGPGQLWIAERTDDGQLLLEHLRRGRWTSTTLDASARSGARLATEGGETALVVDGRLFLEDSGEWQEVLLPKASGSRVNATSVALGEDGDIYVGATGSMRGGAALYRYDGHRWTSLGNPSPDAADVTPADIRLAGDDVLVRWWRSDDSTDTVWRRDDAGWQRQFGVDNRETTMNAWIVRDSAHQVLLGRRYAWNDDYVEPTPACVRWTEPSQEDCSTSTAVDAADLRSDGQMVIGGWDSVTSYALRDKGGNERPLSGSPYGQVIAIESEPGTHTVWALTGSSRLQRYVW